MTDFGQSKYVNFVNFCFSIFEDKNLAAVLARSNNAESVRPARDDRRRSARRTENGGPRRRGRNAQRPASKRETPSSCLKKKNLEKNDMSFYHNTATTVK